MNKLNINLEHCYGINRLNYEFEFPTYRTKAFAIYAPNGVMKTSFARTFEQLSKGDLPRDERFNKPTTCTVEADELPLPPDSIYVLKAEIDISTESPAVSNILVDPANKERYDEVVLELEGLKSSLLTLLQRKSRVKKVDVEQKVVNDFGAEDFASALQEAQEIDSLELNVEYNTIFDPKSLQIISSQDFIQNANAFNERYRHIFEQAGTVYRRGVFNPQKAETSLNTLDKQGFFQSGHKVHLDGDADNLDKEQFAERLAEINATIDADAELKSIRVSLAKNAQTQALINLLENLPPEHVDLLLEKVRPDNIEHFKKELWATYINEETAYTAYIESYDTSKEEIEAIERNAATAVPRWRAAVERFNDRFVDMPFNLSVENLVDAGLGRDTAKLQFTFRDSQTDETVTQARHELKTLSQGEKRALYLLNFIFEVEERKQRQRETLFIIDDAADSFDYKNKHAIIQYLDDLTKETYFFQIILTHNFDLFRTLNNGFVHYKHCLTSSKSGGTISLDQAEGVRNIFIKLWKPNITNCENILCASAPFARNLIEYTLGDDSNEYKTLTHLLHWKDQTNSITIGDYLAIYNGFFGTNHSTTDDTRIFVDLLLQQADLLATNLQTTGLNLERKVVLSMAIRIKAEQFLIQELRTHTQDPNYWCTTKNQWGKLMEEYRNTQPSPDILARLEKVSITVSSNIHLNSFMYEPILDLTVEHLNSLYKDIKNLP